jgi:2-polyprenyl-3-methyl-5-hydroxy-6-metoxy-1,4-benzoquinol methylase
MKRIFLEDIKLNPVTQQVYEDYVIHFGTEQKKGIYRYKNFPRFSYVLDLLKPTKNVLDVGVFTGQFLDCLALSGKFESVTGIDIVQKPGFRTISDNYEFKIADATSLPFPDNHFDAVVCMEVLEHLEIPDFPKALAEIRRVCAGQLIMSVPYNEQPPLSTNHRQAFDDAKLLQCFPDANMTILSEIAKDQIKDIWVMMEE